MKKSNDSRKEKGQKWFRPRLNVLTRSVPEETVLQNCKHPVRLCLGSPSSTKSCCWRDGGSGNCQTACFADPLS